jgi:hypothetical protein
MVTSDDCLKKYGDPESKGAQSHLVVWLVPDELRAKIECLPVKIYCNRDMIPNFQNSLRIIADEGLGDMIISFDGCFNIRRKKGGISLSLHSWAIAFDINASTNAFGAKPTLNSRIVQIFKSNGFDWGGDWRKPDGMHFQLAKI